MSFWLLFYQSVFVLSIWWRACWPLQYHLYMQLYQEMALCVAKIAKLTLNVLKNEDTAPCPFLMSSGVEPALPLVLLGWMVHCSCLSISQSICIEWADVCGLGCSLCPGKIQSEVTVLNRLVDWVWLQLSSAPKTSIKICIYWSWEEHLLLHCISSGSSGDVWKLSCWWWKVESMLSHFYLGHGRILWVNSIMQWFYQLSGVWYSCLGCHQS